MACSASHDDIAIFTVDGTNYLGLARSATMRLQIENREASVIGTRRDHSQPGIKVLQLEGSLLSFVSAGVFHDDTSVSEFTITSTTAGAFTTPINYLERISLSVSAALSDHAPFGAAWREECQDSYSLTGSIELRIPKAAYELQEWIEDVAGDSDEAVITVSLVPYSGGPDYNVSFTVSEIAHQMDRGAQIVTITLGDNQAGTSPAASSDLASHILMAENIAFSVESEPTNGMVYTAGTAILQSVEMEFAKGALQTYNFTARSVGAPTVSDQVS
jgi:hypothetical protein